VVNYPGGIFYKKGTRGALGAGKPVLVKLVVGCIESVWKTNPDKTGGNVG